jgi:hypothetical protein
VKGLLGFGAAGGGFRKIPRGHHRIFPSSCRHKT